MKIPWWLEVAFVGAVVFYFLAPLVGGLALFRAEKSQRRFTILGTLSFVVGLIYVVLTLVAAIMGGGQVVVWIIPPLLATCMGYRAIQLRRKKGASSDPPPLPPAE